MPANTLFEPDKADLRDEAKVLLDQAAQILKQHPEAGIRITGHTASTGTEPSGLELSLARADAVAMYLVQAGVDGSRIDPQGVGDTQPSCEDWDPATGTQIEACAATERNVTLVATGVVLCDN